MEHVTSFETVSTGSGTADTLTDDGTPVLLTGPEAVGRLRRRLIEHSNELSRTMKILEAGCGREWELDLAPAEIELTGVDLDAHALDHRRSVTRDLDVGIVGTISDRDIVPSSHYDVVYSAYVLEHIDGATLALENFTRWVRPGGLIVMLLPNRDSVYGWLARRTPHRVHVWIYRYLFGNRNAGKPGFSPYPTYHDPEIAPDALLAFCRKRNFSVLEILRCKHIPGGSWSEVRRSSAGDTDHQSALTRSPVVRKGQHWHRYARTNDVERSSPSVRPDTMSARLSQFGSRSRRKWKQASASRLTLRREPRQP